ncbi:HNH endonuclease [Paenibacillus sp. TAF43_2]|uniref:HNH endonuclease n=1 Tax=Paenibacillus sp. TAF43_2 TaxID=3233069 RepID=UPI003F9C2930
MEKVAEQRRGSAHSRGYNHKWNKARERFLKQHPVCVHCQNDGKIVAASVVDHIIPHKGDQEKFWDVTNWQPLCETHHNIKTVKYDGGFGR